MTLVYKTMKTYICSSQERIFQIIIPSVISACGLFTCIAVFFTHIEYSLPAILIGIICLYTIYNTFLTGSYPDKVIVTNNYIAFSCMGKIQYYKYNEIKYFKVRDSQYSKNMFLRINRPLFGKGRFWINTRSFHNGNDLYEYIINLEYKIHPNSLKNIARNKII